MSSELSAASMEHDSEKKNEELRNRPPSVEAPGAPSALDDFPEGGLRAWSVVWGGFFAFIATFGMVNSYGVFQDYYQTSLMAHSSSSTIALIGALQLFFLYGGGPVIGRVLNVLVPSTLIASIITLALWLPATDQASITAFAAMYGTFTGAFVSLLPAYVYTISPIEVYGARLGSMYLLVGIANLVGTPTAGAFLTTINQRGFDGLIIFTGIMIAAGSLLLGAVGVVTELRKRKALDNSP
ncbi:hypothetical protein IEO21_09209 [Rhodonia placenta]|uniref:Major facilitator superfamily (MFS) profile domain-containing protein n=1 Tax=Rhodonia placenta TaxID=104341 RepID=A0A8H7TYN7_9APHY|nr:hypothetical protein IEO21_09209 [Postia placenta]